MKRSLLWIVVLASAMAFTAEAQTSPAAAAPSAASAGPSKVAVISFQVAVAQTNEGQREYGALEKKYAPRETQLKSLNDEIESLTKQLQADGAKLTDADRASRAKAIDEKKKKLDRSAEDLRNEGNQEVEKMYNALASKVYDVLTTYARQHGYTVILDVSQQQGPVLYYNQSLEITKAVVEAYNLKSGVPAQPAASAPTPKPGSAAPAPAAH
jgi:outer membrane protein